MSQSGSCGVCAINASGRARFSLVRASFGVATWPEDGTSVHEIIRAADTMMYLVKSSTRDNIAIAGAGIVKP